MRGTVSLWASPAVVLVLHIEFVGPAQPDVDSNRKGEVSGKLHQFCGLKSYTHATAHWNKKGFEVCIFIQLCQKAVCHRQKWKVCF